MPSLRLSTLPPRLVFLLGLILVFAPSAAHAQRQPERLGRAVIAQRGVDTGSGGSTNWSGTGANQVYVGWRLFATDPESISFNVYRSANGAAAVKLNATPVTASTNYVDTTATLTAPNSYSVKPVINGVEGAASESWTLPANSIAEPCFTIPEPTLPDGAHAVHLAWVGDLDGDGYPDIVVDRLPSVVGGTIRVEAYSTRTRTRLWTIDGGPNSANIFSNGQNDGITVYDFDGDGKCEVVIKSVAGTVFGDGAVLPGSATTVYMSIVDGATGAEKSRFQIATAISAATDASNIGIGFLDGVHPGLVIMDASHLYSAYDVNPTTFALTKRWGPVGGGPSHGHGIRIGDINGDGKDDLSDMGVAFDHNGNQLFQVDVNHGDRYHIADIDPDRPGLECFAVQQDNPTQLSCLLYDAATGQVLWRKYASGMIDNGRGNVGSLDPATTGMQSWSVDGTGLLNQFGNPISTSQPYPNFSIWWDDDVLREGLNEQLVDKWNVGRLLTGYKFESAGYSARSAVPFYGDILGDWREEIITEGADASGNPQLVIFNTTKVTNLRFYTLLQDPQYRDDLTIKGYEQSHHLSFYFGQNMPRPPRAPVWNGDLTWVGNASGNVWNTTTALWKNSATGVATTYADGKSVLFDLTGVSSTAVTLNGMLSPSLVVVHAPKGQAYAFGGGGSLAGTMTLTKGGQGSLSLGGAHSFTGQTIVSEGSLLVTGSLTGSPVRVDSRGTLGGTGTITQAVSFPEVRGVLAPGGLGAVGTIALSGGLSETGGTVNTFDLASNTAAGSNDRVAVTGNLTLSGANIIQINPLNGALAAGGTYTLFTYTGTFTGTLSSLIIRGADAYPCTLANTGSAITLTVGAMRTSAGVTWAGGASGVWKLNGGSGWLKGGATDGFVSGDTATFDDSGAATPTVTLSSTVLPASTGVNSSATYTFSGTGAIAGPGGLTKSGAGALTISTANTFTGPASINGGVLAVPYLTDGGMPSPIGASDNTSSNLTINGGMLRVISGSTSTFRGIALGSSGGAIDLPSSTSTLNLSGVLSGTGSLTKTGAGLLILNAVNTYSGGTIIQSGKLVLTGSRDDYSPTSPIQYGLGSGSVTLQGGTLTLTDTSTGDTDTVDSQSYWPVIVPAGATARLELNGRSIFGGALTGSGTLTLFTPFVRTDLTGDWSAFTGKINVVTDSDGGDFRIANTKGYANAWIDLAANVFCYSRASSTTTTIDIGALSGAAGSVLNATASGSGLGWNEPALWRIGARNIDTTFNGVIAGSSILTKVGTGTLTLTGSNTYAGATTVSAGKLVLSGGSLAGSNVTVASGAGFGGNGTVTGNVNFNASSTLLTNATAGPLAITGNLTFGGNVTVSPAFGSALSPGTYALYTYTGTLTGTPTFSWSGAGYKATFDTSTAGQVKITLTALPRGATDITWTGALGSPWDSSTQNWNWAAGATAFQTDDRVRFDDTSAVTSINIAASVSPASVTVDAAQDYTFAGTAAISGTGTLVKSGTGTLTISPTVLSVSSTTTTGSPTVTVTSATGLAVGMTISGTGIPANTTITAISGTTLTLSQNATTGGTNTLSYYAANTYSGGTVITAGTIGLANSTANSTALGTGTVKLNGGTLKLYSTGASSTSSGTFSNAIQVDSGNIGTLTGWGRGTLSSTLLGSGTLNYQTDYVRADVTGNWSGFTGQISVTPGASGGDFRINNTSGFGTAKINLASGVTMYMNVGLGSGGLTNTIGELTGAGTLKGGPTSGRTMTWSIGGANTNAQFDGAIKDNTGPTAIIKSGTGAWTLSGTNTYTGATTVTSGALYVTGSLGTTAMTVSSGAAIGGTGTLSGNLTLASGAQLALGVGASSTKGLTVSGTSTLNGTITVVPVSFGGTLAPGTYTVFSYTGTLGGSPNFTWFDTTGSGLLATFDTSTAGQVRITLRTPLQAWRQFYFGDASGTGNMANSADFDGDGISNLMEYATGTNPKVASPPVCQTQISGSHLQITFNRIADPSLTYTVQGSSDLANWSDLWTSTGAANTAGPVTVSDTASTSDSSRRFLRLKVGTTSP